ncbi:MAG: GNAT family N-acetyltransferase [Bacteroidales bacterium]|nr:GNAT family N-acetyltransferase [Bacteroidales bacterium]
MNSEKIKLRALEPSDAQLLFEWENDQSIWYLSNTIAPFSKFDIEQYILNSEKDIFSNKQLRLMIDKKISNSEFQTIGSIDIFDFDPINKRAGIGILIIKEERNKGLASEALDVLIKYGFETLDLHQFYCNISTENEVSLKLFKKKNFQPVGIKKAWNFRNGKFYDEYLLQLVNE